MAANIELLNDAGEVITSFNFGAIDGGTDLGIKFFVKNIGNTPAQSVRIFAQRLSQNDGLDFVQMALDNGGNPGAYTTNLAEGLSIGTLNGNDSQAFWVKVTVPTGTTPAGNPRLFDAVVEYTGI